MKLPFSWIKECIALPHTSAEIAKILTLAGLEVDGIEVKRAPFSGVVSAKVLETRPHPNADKLQLATVTDGSDTVELVCGAPNCRPGLITALAKIGAILPDGESTFKVKKASVRGCESYGMLCSPKELQLGDDHDGIVEFPENTPLGADLAAQHTDEIFDIALTPNLNHCANLQGVVRELSAFTTLPYRLPQAAIPQEKNPSIQETVKIQIDDSEACPRYSCRMIEGVKIGPSPAWLRDRVEQCGIRSVNNVVDATNYVLMELGQPLHAFDFNTLSGARLHIRTANPNETITTLDGKQRQLQPTMLLICDADKPVAIAGVIGGANSEVSDSTTAILIESAYFSPTSIRRTSKALGISSEASRRFERGADPAGTLAALERATALIQEVAGGHVLAGFYDLKQAEPTPRKVSCRLSKINSLIGHHFGVSEIENLFKRLGFPYEWDGKDAFHVAVPTYRVDISIEVDLIEEVARLYGYINIEKREPHYQASKLPHAPIYLLEQEVRARMIAEGLQEFLTCDLIGPSILDIVRDNTLSDEARVTVLNPTSIEQSILRQSLLPGLLQTVKTNYDHNTPNVAAFEVGRIHFRQADQYKEQSVLAIVLTGLSRPYHFDPKPPEFDFFDLKGLVENLLQGLRIPNYTVSRSDLNIFHPGRQAAITVNELKIGTIGEIHPDLQKRLDIPQRIYFAELNLHDIYPQRQVDPRMTPLSQYPASDRDWTLTVPNTVPVQEILDAITSARSTILVKVSVHDLYRNERLGKNSNITLRFQYRDPQKTLAQEKVDREHDRITKQVLQKITLIRQPEMPS